jgi:hypothetical protein
VRRAQARPPTAWQGWRISRRVLQLRPGPGAPCASRTPPAPAQACQRAARACSPSPEGSTRASLPLSFPRPNGCIALLQLEPQPVPCRYWFCRAPAIIAGRRLGSPLHPAGRPAGRRATTAAPSGPGRRPGSLGPTALPPRGGASPAPGSKFTAGKGGRRRDAALQHEIGKGGGRAVALLLQSLCVCSNSAVAVDLRLLQLLCCCVQV